MSSSKAPQSIDMIPETTLRAVIERWDDTRESLAQFWLSNPAFAKQGGIEVQKLLSPDNAIWLAQYEFPKNA